MEDSSHDDGPNYKFEAVSGKLALLRMGPLCKVWHLRKENQLSQTLWRFMELKV